MNELILCESETLRKELCIEKNTSVLEKIGQIVYLSKTQYATLKNVAQFYQVPVEALESILRRHSSELKEDGYKILSRKDLEIRHLDGFKIPNRGLAVFSRRAILRIGMLLRDSLIAQKVRSYLLNIEEFSEKTSNSYENLNEMARQLTSQAIELGSHANQLTQHAERLNANNEQLQENASQLTRNATQLIFQSKLIKAMVEEIYENKHQMRKLELNLDAHDSKLSLHDKRFEALEQITNSENEGLSEEQIALLKKRVKAKGAEMKVWARFKKYFKVTRYRHLPKKKFREALDWLESYESE